MQIGDLITWKVDVENGEELDFGVVVGKAGALVGKRGDLLWVKFLTGSHSNKKKTLCKKEHLILVEEINKKRT